MRMSRERVSVIFFSFSASHRVVVSTHVERPPSASITTFERMGDDDYCRQEGKGGVDSMPLSPDILNRRQVPSAILSHVPHN